MCTGFFTGFENDWTVVAAFFPRQGLYQNVLQVVCPNKSYS